VAATRRAIYLPSQGRALFAWIHEPSAAARRDHAVLICPPAGHEQVHSHRALRHLAERLADAGFVAVRFDFAGTGDSADYDESANPFGTWLANIGDVLSYARADLGAGRITLMGLRLGGLLATQAAAETAVDGLILWEPVVRGRAYARELTALSKMADPIPPTEDTAEPDYIEAGGFAFSKVLVDDISGADLTKVNPQCRQGLILSRDNVVASDKLRQHFLAVGITAEQDTLAGYADMLAEPHCTKVPREAIAKTVDWLLANSMSAGAMPPLQADHSAADRLGIEGHNPFTERIIRFGPGKLFGIATEPAQASDLPLVIMPNAGSAYRVGPGRLHVMLARRLASLGFPALRFDLTGLGDSVALDPDQENDPYAATAFRDIDAALQFARTQLGSRRCLLLGLCSGAYFAFQAAAQLDDATLVESILINPLTFFWKDGMTMESPEAIKQAAYRYYKAAALKPSKWLKLLSGKTKIGIGGVFNLVLHRLKGSSQAAPGSSPTGTRAVGHPAENDLAGDLERVRQHHRRLACFFARSDPGYDLLMAARRKVKQLSRASQLSIHFIEHADHTFSRQQPRRALLDALEGYLTQRYRP
jgi:alpha-beta hydrolase superfamily lysophospholipase